MSVSKNYNFSIGTYFSSDFNQDLCFGILRFYKHAGHLLDKELKS